MDFHGSSIFVSHFHLSLCLFRCISIAGVISRIVSDGAPEFHVAEQVKDWTGPGQSPLQAEMPIIKVWKPTFE